MPASPKRNEAFMYNRPKIGEILVAQGAVSAEDLQRALAEQHTQATPKRIGQILLGMEAVEEFALLEALGEQFGLEVRGTSFFADHHELRQQDWIACVQKARTAGADAILTTEKDAIKTKNPPDFPLFVAVQAIRISDANAFACILKDCVEERK